MLAKIRHWEDLARVLEPDTTQRRQLEDDVDSLTNRFLDEITTSRIYHPDTVTASIYNRLAIHPKPISIHEILHLISNYVVEPGFNVTSPGFFGYIPGGGLYASALGDFIAAVTNRFAGAFFVSPGATRLENIVLRWLCQLMGYTKEASGNLSSGGSLANFIGIVTAREAFNLKGKDFKRVVVYASSQVHHSVIKALRVAGLKEAIIRFLPVDEAYCLNSIALREAILRDSKKNLIPWLIVATIGTTNTGSIDPIEDIAVIAKRHRLWLHVDAAYGGFFILCPEIKKQISSIRQADSITIDPHKGLFIPYGLGAILTKKESSLLKAYYYDEIDYLPNLNNEYDELSPAALSPELSKHFRGLRLWLPLKLYGILPFKAALKEKLLLANYFYSKLRQMNNVEIACIPQLSIVTFRYCPKVGDANSFNQLLSKKITQDGRVFFSTTYLNHKLYLRMACLNFRTHIDSIKAALEILNKSINELINNY